MKTAEEWAKEIPEAANRCNGKIDGRRCDCMSTLDCDLEMSAIAQIIRSAQRDAIESAMNLLDRLDKSSASQVILSLLPPEP